MLPVTDWQNKPYPLKSILMLNEDVYNALVLVTEDLTLEQLNFVKPEVPNRKVEEMVNHLLDCQCRFYLQELIFGEKQEELKFNPVQNPVELQERITEYYQKMVNLYQKIDPRDFGREIITSWGQKLTVELACFQAITHVYYHVSEICFLRGLGGFYNQALG
jgi:hypothetical protein